MLASAAGRRGRVPDATGRRRSEVGTVAVARAGGADAAAPEDALVCACPIDRADDLIAWLRDLSDGYVRFDPEDLLAKVDGPVAIGVRADVDAATLPAVARALESTGERSACARPSRTSSGSAMPTPVGDCSQARVRLGAAGGPARTDTPLHGEHKRLGARMVPFAGWEMPVWYTSIADEHATVRQGGGPLRPRAHGRPRGGGRGRDALPRPRLDQLRRRARRRQGAVLATCSTPTARPLDDILVYRRADERYMVVVNASNEDKVMAWLQAVVYAARA